jgi:hypothetical protein
MILLPGGAEGRRWDARARLPHHATIKKIEMGDPNHQKIISGKNIGTNL